ncbi:MAG: Phosphatidylinositol 4-kinase type 2-beta [Caeruleum heppii]|nr:MAG: Phosphatidylinositol 4-kinase type 2-beta [Caeruleum heppii]
MHFSLPTIASLLLLLLTHTTLAELKTTSIDGHEIIFTSATPTPAIRGRTDNNKGCNADNCLRALRNPTRAAEAKSFCSSYTTAVVTATAGLPPFATQCGTAPTQASRLSSACSCFQPGPTAPPCTPNGGTCRLEDPGACCGRVCVIINNGETVSTCTGA